MSDRRRRRRGLLAAGAVVAAVTPTPLDDLVIAMIRTLYLGAHGPDVARLQRRLDIPADGNYGPQTFAAVKTYQIAHGLTVDGIAGPEVQAALNGTLPETATATSWGAGPDAPFVLQVAPGWMITSDFGPRGDGPHYGVDVAGPGWDDIAVPFYAPCDGVVTAHNADGWGGGYGTFVYLQPDGRPELEGRAAHLAGRLVGAGDRVSRGQLLGYYGKSGHSFGVHLHWETRRNSVPENPALHTRIEDAPARSVAA